MSLYYFWCLTHLSLIDCSSRRLQSRVGHAWIGCMDWIGLDWIGGKTVIYRFFIQ